MFNTQLKANSILLHVFFFHNNVTDTNTRTAIWDIDTDMLFQNNNTSPKWNAHNVKRFSETVLPLPDGMKMSLAQMHAPSFEAVNLIAIWTQAAISVFLLLPLLLFSWMHPLAESSVIWRALSGGSGAGPQWGVWTHLHTKRLKNTQSRGRRIVSGPFVKRVDVWRLLLTLCHLLQHWQWSDLH